MEEAASDEEQPLEPVVEEVVLYEEEVQVPEEPDLELNPEPVPAEVAGDDDFWGFSTSKKDKKKKKKKKSHGVFNYEEPVMAVDLSEAPPPEAEPEPVIEAAPLDDPWAIPARPKKKKKAAVSWDE